MGSCISQQENGLAEVKGGCPSRGDVTTVQAQLRIALDHTYRNALTTALRW